MGAIKPNNYSTTEVRLSRIGRAMAHPARIQMIKTLRTTYAYRNIDFVQLLQLSKPTIADHIQKLKDADLVEITYLPHCYAISLKEQALNDLSGFITDWA